MNSDRLVEINEDESSSLFDRLMNSDRLVEVDSNPINSDLMNNKQWKKKVNSETVNNDLLKRVTEESIAPIPIEEPTQNVLPLVSLNPTLNESFGIWDEEPRRSQRVTKGVSKKQYEPEIKVKAR